LDIQLSGRQAAFTGTYEPLATGGSRRDDLIAFARGGEIVSVAQRFSLTRSGDWGDSHVMLPAGEYVDCLFERRISGGRCSAAELFQHFPVALLARNS
jgi:(1->4)-alpha-D-glucan 1-alpha-D-glucosylmutase